MNIFAFKLFLVVTEDLQVEPEILSLSQIVQRRKPIMDNYLKLTARRWISPYCRKKEFDTFINKQADQQKCKHYWEHPSVSNHTILQLN